MNSNILDGLDDDLDSAPVRDGKKVFVEICRKCNGTGNFSFVSRYGSKCLECNGLGKKTFKTSAEARSKALASSAKRKEAKLDANESDFAKEHPAVAEFLKTANSSFTDSLSQAVRRYGSLTPAQLGAVERMIADRASKDEANAARVALAPQLDISKIVAAFNRAQANGLERPKLRAGSVIFRLAPSSGINAGSIYAFSDDEYRGKITGDKFLKSRECSAETESEIIRAAADPMDAAIKYGKEHGSCAICGRRLDNPESIERGIGPICADKFGF